MKSADVIVGTFVFISKMDNNIIIASVITIGGLLSGYKVAQFWEQYKKRNQFHYDQIAHFSHNLKQCTRECKPSVPDYMVAELKMQFHDKLSQGKIVTENDIEDVVLKLVQKGDSKYIDCYIAYRELYLRINGVPILDISNDEQKRLTQIYREILGTARGKSMSRYFKSNLVLVMILGGYAWRDVERVIQAME
jgi:hypothetical protein